MRSYNLSLLVFWISLNRELRDNEEHCRATKFRSATMVQLQPWLIVFALVGIVLLMTLLFILLPHIKLFFFKTSVKI